jgi:hypothetical protein
MNNVLGPRNLRGIFGETFKIIGRNFLRLLAIAAIVEVPLRTIFWIGILFEFWIRSRVSSIIPEIAATLLFTVARALVFGALIHAVSQQYLRHTVDIGRAYRFALGRLWPLTAILILVLLLTRLAGMLSSSANFPAVVGFCAVMLLVAYWACALQAASLEGLGVSAAMSRSSALVKGNWLRVLGVFLVLIMILAVISGTTSMLDTKPKPTTLHYYVHYHGLLEALRMARKAITAIAATLISAIAFTLLYYDLRVRKEGYSLESLAKELKIKIDSESHEKNL